MNLLIRFLFLMGILFYLNFCKQNKVDPEISEVKIELITMDGCPGPEKYNFDAEDDITLALKVTNNSTDSINWGNYFNLCEIANNEENFYLVYKKTPSNELIEIGRPFQIPLGCLDIQWPWPFYLRPKSQVILSGISWLDNPENSRLLPGTYYSRIDFVLGNKTFESEVTFLVD